MGRAKISFRAANAIEIPCNLCGSEDYKILVSKEGFQVVACSNCGLWRQNPCPTDEEIKKIYDKDYYCRGWGLDEDEASVREMKRATFRKRMAEIEKYIKPGRILDVGCATGFFLEVAKEKGWQPFGVEISEYSANLAKEKFGANIFKGSLEQIDLEDNSFDGVTMYDLIEHQKNPKEILRIANRILKQDGFLFLTTPNSKSLDSRILGKNWLNFIRDEHLYYFSPATIEKILQANGFEVIQVSTAIKAVSLFYIKHVLKKSEAQFFAFVFAFIVRLLPNKIAKKIFLIPSGDMLVIARKVKDIK